MTLNLKKETIKTLKPIGYKKAYERVIARKIMQWLWSNVFEGCFKILEEKTVFNSSGVEDLIRKEQLVYVDNYIYSVSGRFSSAISAELKSLGAKYSKRKNAYYIKQSDLPIGIATAIDQVKAKAYFRAYALQEYLTKQLRDLGPLTRKFVIKETVNKIMLDLQERVYKNAEEKNIEFITPKLTDFQKNEIAKNYTNNLDYWIKGWTEDKIVQMREHVAIMAQEGKSTQQISQYLQKQWGVAEDKAKFLARNESAIATASYLIAKYKEEGFTKYRWHTVMDGRERQLHKDLNMTIQEFDNPPVIYDNKKGKVQRGNPGETYNCRCTIEPIIDKDFLKNRAKVKGYIWNSIKDFFNAQRSGKRYKNSRTRRMDNS